MAPRQGSAPQLSLNVGAMSSPPSVHRIWDAWGSLGSSMCYLLVGDCNRKGPETYMAGVHLGLKVPTSSHIRNPVKRKYPPCTHVDPQGLGADFVAAELGIMTGKGTVRSSRLYLIWFRI